MASMTHEIGICQGGWGPNFQKLKTVIYSPEIREAFKMPGVLTITTLIHPDEHETTVAIRPELIETRKKHESPLTEHICAVKEYLTKLPGGAVFDAEQTSIHNVKIDFDDETLETKLRFPKRYFNLGPEYNEMHHWDLTVKTSTGPVRSVLFDVYGNDVAIEKYGSLDMVSAHAYTIDSIIKKLCKQEKVDKEDSQYMNVFERISWVDYWGHRRADMLRSASEIAKIIRTSRLSSHIKDILLMGSLRSNDKIPGDIDLAITVDDPTRSILYAGNYQQDLSDPTYPEYETTNGLFVELDVAKALAEYSKKSCPVIRYEENRKIPANMQFGASGATMQLTSIHMADLKDIQSAAAHAKKRVSPSYLIDILCGDKFEGEDFLPKDTYWEQIGILQKVIYLAEKEKWPNHMNDSRYWKH